MSPTPRLTGRVVFPDDPGYEAARKDYNALYSRHPRAIVFGQYKEDVANAVRWTLAYNAQHPQDPIPLRIRCGRHHYEGYSNVDKGLVIDVSNMDKVTVHRDRQVAEVEAGVQLLDLYFTLYQVGFSVPGGSCPTVGLSGLVLGGGFGLQSRLHGLTCDSLEEVELVTSKGEILVANAHNRHQDLFWACCGGGGGNFGIATKFTFRLHEARHDVTIYKIHWSWTELEAVLDAWQRWAPQVDPRLTSILTLSSQERGRITSIGQFAGTRAELRSLLQPLIDASQPSDISIRQQSLLEAVHYFAGMRHGQRDWQVHWHSDQKLFKNSSAYAYKTFDRNALQIIKQFLSAPPSADNLLQFDAYGGNIAKLRPDQTAFYHRHARIGLQYQSYWSSPNDTQANIRWVEAFRRALLPHTKGAYVNYPDQSITDYMEAYYGTNKYELARIKKRYDPDNVFQFPQVIKATPY